MKQLYVLLLSSIAFFSAHSQGLVISQVYGAGGNASATYNADFVEIFNSSASPINLSGYSIQYASATGTAWQKSDLPAATLAGGQYFLLQMSTVGATGVALPTPDATAAPAIAMSGTAGKVALVNSTVALSGTQCPPPFVPAIIDYVGYGTTANCFEGAGPTVAPGNNANSLQRGANGCTDLNNNATDFTAAIATARNSASAINPCGPAVPTLIAGPNITNITTTVSVPSAPQTISVSGFNLTGFPGNISVTASAGLEVSLTSGSGYANAISIPFASASLPATTVYVRIAAAAPQGIITGTVTSSGAGATNAVVTVNGRVTQDYYNTKANTGLTNLSTWSTTTNGAGPSPLNFTNAYQVFNIISQANANYSGVWNVAGNNSKIVVGDGIAAIVLTIPAGLDSITTATRVDVLNNATLTIQNERRPFLNNLATGSTVDFAQNGTTSADTVRIPNISFYNLKLSNGLKYFSSNITTVRGNLTANGVVSMNGSSPVFSTVNVFGNVNFTASNFEPLPSGDAARITLAMNGGSAQDLISNTPILLFRLQRDTVTSNGIINLTGTLVLGNSAGGGLRLNQGASTSTVLNMPTLGTTISIIGGAVVTSSSLGKIYSEVGGGSISILKSAGNANAGVLRFASGTLLSGLLISFDPAFARDSIFIADSVGVAGLLLTKGKVIVNSGAVLTVRDGPTLSGGHITGGSPASFVEGKLRRLGFFTGGDSRFPVGKGSKYAPIDLDPMAGDFTVQYFFNGYGNYLIDPITLSTYPGYQVSSQEYWQIEKANTLFDPTIIFYYTDAASGIIDPTQVKIAHFDGTDWDDLGGTAAPGNTTTNGSVTVTNVTTFSPFTFSGRTLGVIPVRLSSFTVQKLNASVRINWTTEQETNSKEFIVERSSNGTSWYAIATMAAAGNSSSRINYSTIDNNPVKGINFYRIRQVDKNDLVEFSVIRSVLFNSSYQLFVTPNPATDKIDIYLDNTGRQVNIKIFDVAGNCMRNLQTDQQFISVNTSGLARAVYIVKLWDGKNSSTTKIVLR